MLAQLSVLEQGLYDPFVELRVEAAAVAAKILQKYQEIPNFH